MDAKTLAPKDGLLTISRSDERLAALDPLFDILAPEGDELLIRGITASAGGAGLTLVGDASDVWGADSVTVSFVFDEGGEQALLRVDLSKATEGVSDLGLDGLRFEDLETHARIVVAEPTQLARSSVEAWREGVLRVGESKGVPIRLDFLGSQTRLSTGFKPGDGPSLTDLAALLGTAHDADQDLRALPEELFRPELVQLEEVHLTVDPEEERTLADAGVKIGFGRGADKLSWPLIPGLTVLTLEDLGAGLEVLHPLDPTLRFPTIDVRGTIAVGGGRLVLSARWPDFAVRGELVEGEAISLHRLLQDLGLPVGGLPAGGSGPAIDRLSLTAEPMATPKGFSVLASCAEPWSLHDEGDAPGPAFAIERVSLGLSYRESLRGFVSGTLNVAGVDLHLRAGNDEGADGWSFEGRAAEDKPIPLADLLADLGSRFGVEQQAPPALSHLPELRDLAVSFHTKTKDFAFHGRIDFPLEDGPNARALELDLSIELTHHGDGGYRREFRGALQVGSDLRFELRFAQEKAEGGDAGASQALLATFRSEAGVKLNVHELFKAHVSDDFARFVPKKLELTLHDALLAYQKDASGKSRFLFGLDVGAGVDLSNLPLVGEAFPPEQGLNMDFRLLVASASFGDGELKDLNQLLPSGIATLPRPEGGAGLDAGLGLATTLQIGGETVHLDLPVSTPTNKDAKKANEAGQGGVPVGVQSGGADSVTWIDVQKHLGPVHFARVGATFEDGEVAFYLDASLSLAGLTFTLDGLSVATPLDRFRPRFGLRGLGLDYANGPLEIAGAFLRGPGDEFSGAALIKTSKLTLSAIGSYASVEGHPSLFVYAVLDYPLGGPSFFFVTGLAAGFGYNRGLILPEVDEVESFPLVASAVRGAGLPEDITGELEALHEYLPVDVGSYFLAVGLKFNSFKLIDSFALLTVTFGNHFEIGLLGLSTLIIPTPDAAKAVAPLAEIHVALRARFAPDEGVLEVQAVLTAASYVFSKDCHLTGGFAFFSWFSGPLAGDFVVTLGGYHPEFDVPEHYPTVPRLGFNWQISDALSAKGGLYYALTAHALMAGGFLEINYDDGSLKAWFKAGADFLIAWKPYHYSARIYIDVGASLGPISVDLGADLRVFGPDFSGTAELDLWIATYTVDFGDAEPALRAIDWETFSGSFLPQPEDVCGASLTGGLLKRVQTEDEELWIVTPSELTLVTNSVIPSKTAILGSGADKVELKAATTAFGIAPMDLGAAALATAEQLVTIVREDVHVEDEFSYRPILKRAPTGLWGTSMKAGANAESFVDDTLAGFEIRPAPALEPDESLPIRRENLQFRTEAVERAFRFGFAPFLEEESAGDAPEAREQRRDRIRSTITAPEVVAARRKLFDDLQVDSASVNLGGFDEAKFVRVPAVGVLTDPRVVS
ncbi:MAG: DUF6603 domain-containing protein [Planctomycetota bacterium]